MFPFLAALGILLATGNISGQSDTVLVFTSAYNRPDFLIWQHKTLKKFLRDKYELVVFNDAEKPEMIDEIHRICRELKLQCIDVPSSAHPSTVTNIYRATHRNGEMVDYSLKVMGCAHDGIVALLDSDLFMTDYFSISEYMKDKQIAAPFVCGKLPLDERFPWVGLSFLNMSLLPNKHEITYRCGHIRKIWRGPGGFVPFYAKKHNVKIDHLGRPGERWALRAGRVLPPSIPALDWFFSRPELVKFYKKMAQISPEKRIHPECFVHGTFIHYVSGTNWNKKSATIHQQKTEAFQELIDDLMKK